MATMRIAADTLLGLVAAWSIVCPPPVAGASPGREATPAPVPGAKVPVPGAKVPAPGGAPAGAPAVVQLEPYVETIPGTVVTFEMVPVPAADGVGPFWIGRTEVTWDEYDVFALGLDLEPRARRGVDAESRPSRPYGAPDRGFGHAGFAAISVTFEAATAYARWLAETTGRSYRLPTAAQWRHACELGFAGVAELGDHAWHAGNSGGTPHAVGSKRPDALGLVDVLGNVGEWAADPGGEPALHGGAYRDPPEAVHCGARAERTPAWNERDPQIPESTWWLSDGPFAGFRIVRIPDDAAAEHDHSALEATGHAPYESRRRMVLTHHPTLEAR